MDRNQLLFAMGVIKGMLASAIDEDVKMSLNISLELIGKTLQGYEMVMPAPEELKEPEPVYANNEVLTEAPKDNYGDALEKEYRHQKAKEVAESFPDLPEESVDDYLPNMFNRED